jgi:cytochrome c biogenesis factor
MWADIKMVLKVAGIVFLALAIAIGSIWYSRLP